MPTNPGSEIGVSITRWVPNSSTSPESTLKGVPASATSSPIRKTVGSRRISSAIASLTAWDRVISRIVSSSIRIDMHVDFGCIRVGRGLGIGHGLRGILGDRGIHRLDLVLAGDALGDKPGAEADDGIAVFLPVLLFLFRAVVFTVDVPDMVAVIAVGHQFHEEGALAL